MPTTWKEVGVITLHHNIYDRHDIEWGPTDLQVKEAQVLALQVRKTYEDANRYEDGVSTTREALYYR